MDKETLKSRIVAKLGKTSLSDRSINDFAESILPFAQETDEYIEAQCRILRSMEGQIRHETSVGIDEFKKGYKPEPTPEPEPKKDPEPDGYKAILDQLKAMQESYNTLKTDFDNQKTEAARAAAKSKVIDTLRKRIKSATGDEPNEFVFGVTTSDVTVDENADIESLIGGLTESYNDNMKKAGLGTGAPAFGNGGSGSDSKAIDSFFEKKALEGKFPTQHQG